MDKYEKKLQTIIELLRSIIEILDPNAAYVWDEGEDEEK